MEDELAAIAASDRALRRLSIEEFFVDFLGGLVPGVLFLVSAAGVVIPVLHSTLRERGRTNHPDLEGAVFGALSAVKDTPNALWVAVFLVFLLVAYVVGHLFYRHDPNRPDRRSFRYLARNANYRDHKKQVSSPRRAWLWVVRPWELDNATMLREELGCDAPADCQFPYPHYDEYLKKRGLDHLLPWAQWTERPEFRTKNYINRLKILLRHHSPDRCASIVRNEAHVRLAASTWYVSGALMTMSFAGLAWLGVLASSRISSGHGTTIADVVSGFLPAATSCGVVTAFSLYARISIAQFYHYQRMREVYYVLETAVAALRKPPHASVAASTRST